jgi:molybdopterin/thiamine biosynthesis adenylyltransferase
MNSRYSRQSFLGSDSQEVLAGCSVGIVGLGGGGSHIAQQLAYIGVGNITLFDPDEMDWPNLNRTVGATTLDAQKRTPKVEVAKRIIKAANENVSVTPLCGTWQEHFEYFRACDIVFGCIDGLLPRKMLEETCRRALIPLIDIGMDVHLGNPYTISGQVIVSIPGEPCLRCMQFIRDTDTAKEESKYGHAGGTPQVIWPNGALASTAVGLFMQMVTPWCRNQERSFFLGYDGNAMTFERDQRFGLVAGVVCPHFGQDDLGDPFWTPQWQEPIEQKNPTRFDRMKKWLGALLQHRK